MDYESPDDELNGSDNEHGGGCFDRSLEVLGQTAVRPSHAKVRAMILGDDRLGLASRGWIPRRGATPGRIVYPFDVEQETVLPCGATAISPPPSGIGSPI